MDRIFTIPNFLSLVRILLIPVFVVLFFREEIVLAAVVLALSGLTDTLDFIRKQAQISEPVRTSQAW